MYSRLVVSVSNANSGAADSFAIHASSWSSVVIVS
jgi:hypothetical protein